MMDMILDHNAKRGMISGYVKGKESSIPDNLSVRCSDCKIKGYKKWFPGGKCCLYLTDKNLIGMIGSDRIDAIYDAIFKE